MASLVINEILEDYVMVIGIYKGVVSKEGANKGRPFTLLHILSSMNGENSVGYNPDTMFFFTDHKGVNDIDPTLDYKFGVGDMVQFMYVGSGDYKKLKHVDVVPSEPVFDKKK